MAMCNSACAIIINYLLVLQMAFGWYLRCEDEDRRTVWDHKAPGGACTRSKQWSGDCRQASGAHQGAFSHFVLCRLLPGRYNTMVLVKHQYQYNSLFGFEIVKIDFDSCLLCSWLELLLLKLREGLRFLSILGDRLVNLIFSMPCFPFY